MGIFSCQKEKKTSDIIKEKLSLYDEEALMPVLKGALIPFWANPTYTGIETEKLPNYVLQWEHFDAIISKANALGGKMYRGDALAQKGEKLGEEISHDCMEGFIASELLHIEDGSSITRRSTYYSGVLAWTGIITLHKTQGKGSFITVNSNYRDF